jgi:uncharacterized phage infection (PIP) family protein YhgE
VSLRDPPPSPPERPTGPYATDESDQLWAFDAIEWLAKRLVEHMTQSDTEFSQLVSETEGLASGITGLTNSVSTLNSSVTNLIRVVEELRATTPLTPDNESKLHAALDSITEATTQLAADAQSLTSLTQQADAASVSPSPAPASSLSLAPDPAQEPTPEPVSPTPAEEVNITTGDGGTATSTIP